MRRALILLLFVCSSQAYAQNLKQITAKDSTKAGQSKSLIRTANDLKSGNWQDVLTSFFQLAASDITGKDHSLNFKANLFAIKIKADPTLLIDTNYVRQKFARNFQFDFSVKLDSSFHLNGFKGGFTWAILNKRDSTVVQFINNTSLQFYRQLEKMLVSLRLSLLNQSGPHIGEFKSADDSLRYQRVHDALADALANAVENSTFVSSQVFASELKKNLQDTIRTNALKELDRLYHEQDSVLKGFLKKVAMQPLLSLSGNADFGTQKGLPNGGGASLVYLQGLSYTSGFRMESDARANVDIKDTMVNSKSTTRSVLDVTGGFNISWVINNKSIFEFKPFIEYRSILQGKTDNERKETFYASGELRVRITDELWIPLTVKYDVKKANFLGFLNVSINMNAFKKS